MILAIDIGNTNIVVGGMEGRRLVFTLRIRSDRNKTVDEYLLEFKGLLELKGVSPSQVEGGRWRCSPAGAFWWWAPASAPG